MLSSGWQVERIKNILVFVKHHKVVTSAALGPLVGRKKRKPGRRGMSSA